MCEGSEFVLVVVLGKAKAIKYVLPSHPIFNTFLQEVKFQL